MATQDNNPQAETIRATVSIQIPHMSTDELTQLYADLTVLKEKYEARFTVTTGEVIPTTR